MAIPVYLWLKDQNGSLVKGDVDIKDREGSIEIMEFMHAVVLPVDARTGRITSKCVHGDYFLIKEQDSSSPYLFNGVSSGSRFTEAILKFYHINHNGEEEEYFRITMGNVRVNEVESFMMDIKKPKYDRHNHLEAFYLAYEKITWHYLDGNIIHSTSWNHRENV